MTATTADDEVPPRPDEEPPRPADPREAEPQPAPEPEPEPETERAPGSEDEPAVPRVTAGLLVLIAAVTGWEFLTHGFSPTVSELARSGGVSTGAFVVGSWWKLLTANLLHANVMHLGMNAFIIYLMGRWLEHVAGARIIVATILWSALGASVGSILIGSASVTIGASGIAFGLVGCALGMDPRGRTVVGDVARQLAVVNIIATFLIPGISIGGHLGGLAAGLLVGMMAARSSRVGVTVAIAAALPAFAMLVLGPRVLPDEARQLRGSVGASLLERQLSGAKLTNGLEIQEAACEPAQLVTEFNCTVDGAPAHVRFSSRDDQWSLRTAG